MLTWFVVQSRNGQLVPFRIRLSDGVPLPPQLPDPKLETLLRNLADSTAADPDRVDLMKVSVGQFLIWCLVIHHHSPTAKMMVWSELTDIPAVLANFSKSGCKVATDFGYLPRLSSRSKYACIFGGACRNGDPSGCWSMGSHRVGGSQT